VSGVSLKEAFRVWLRIGLLSFGGPAGQIALMHRELVESRKWISEARFLHALNYCMLLPGPEAQQLAIYIGWLMHRTLGGVMAGVLFVAPGAVVILLLSVLYTQFHLVPAVAALFFGLKAAVIAIVVDALLRLSRRVLRDMHAAIIALLAFISLFVFRIPFPLVILAAGAIGTILGRQRNPSTAPTQTTSDTPDNLIDRLFATGQLSHTHVRGAQTLRTLMVWLTLWFVPLGLVALTCGSEHVLSREGVFFSKMSVVTFGGAYSALSYVAQRAVEDFGWLRPSEMLDGLALAETTPGPLILVLQFVAYLGAYRSANPPGWLSGTMGAAICLWATFVPCFLWILVGAPYIERLRESRALNAALKAITAAVVGVILNLSVWFALHALFREGWTVTWGSLNLTMPTLSSIDPVAAALTLFALVLVLRVRASMAATLATCAMLGLVTHWLVR
jgi:chromate transporter